MAFQTGSQINPSLGAINYTPYMQGAVAGSQAIGQGIANLGQSFATSIEKYYKKKEEKDLLNQATSWVGNRLNRSPQLAKALGLTPDEKGKYDPKAIEYAAKVVGPGQILQIGQALDAQEAAKASESRIASAIFEMQSGASPGMSLVGQEAAKYYGPSVSPTEQLAAIQGYSALRSAEIDTKQKVAQTKLIEAETQKALRGEVSKGFNTIEEAMSQGNIATGGNPDLVVLPEPTNDGKFTYRLAQKATTSSEVKASRDAEQLASSKVLYESIKPQVDGYVAAKNSLDNLEQAYKEVSEGKAFSGIGSEFLATGAKVATFLGSDKFKDRLAARDALVTAMAKNILSTGQTLKGSTSDKDLGFLTRAAGGEAPGEETLKKLIDISRNQVSNLKANLEEDILSQFSEFTFGPAKAYERALLQTAGFRRKQAAQAAANTQQAAAIPLGQQSPQPSAAQPSQALLPQPPQRNFVNDFVSPYSYPQMANSPLMQQQMAAQAMPQAPAIIPELLRMASPVQQQNFLNPNIAEFLPPQTQAPYRPQAGAPYLLSAGSGASVQQNYLNPNLAPYIQAASAPQISSPYRNPALPVPVYAGPESYQSAAARQLPTFARDRSGDINQGRFLNAFTNIANEFTGEWLRLPGSDPANPQSDVVPTPEFLLSQAARFPKGSADRVMLERRAESIQRARDEKKLIKLSTAAQKYIK